MTVGYTIKTKDQKVFKHKGLGIIFETYEDAVTWVSFHRDEFDKHATMGDVLTADERIALEGCGIIRIEESNR